MNARAWQDCELLALLVVCFDEVGRKKVSILEDIELDAADRWWISLLVEKSCFELRNDASVEAVAADVVLGHMDDSRWLFETVFACRAVSR